MTFEQTKTDSRDRKLTHADPAMIMDHATHHQSDISSLLESYRGELHLHSYRLMGSLDDAEDMVQETMLRAWRHFDTYKGSASLRTWLYTIATNACLDALKKRSARLFPTTAFPEASPLNPVAKSATEIPWLEPFPDTWLAEATENPEARYSRRESVSLAFLTTLQLLPPCQRAILILSDVLDWSAREVAELLGVSVSAVNSALYRARVTLAQHYHAETPEMRGISLADAATRSLLSRYLQAWETDDVAGLVNLLKEDAILSMPPIPSWFRGREAIRSILLERFECKNQWRMYETSANGQPAFVLYQPDETRSSYQALGIQVLTLDRSQLPPSIPRGSSPPSGIRFNYLINLASQPSFIIQVLVVAAIVVFSHLS